MSDMTVHEELVTILVDQLDVDVAAITPTASLVHDLGADSLDVIEVCLTLQETLGVTFSDDDIDRISQGTVGDALAFLEAQLEVVRPEQEVRRG